MKYSFMSFSTPDYDLVRMLEAAKHYGYDGVEPRLDANHAHGVEVNASTDQRESIKSQVAGSGIELSCLATSLRYADPAQSEAMRAQTHERIDLAGDLGVKTLRVFGGAIPEGTTREKAIDLLVESLGSVADHAEERGVTLCMETHDDWCDPKHVASVMEQVGRSRIAVNWDIMHPVRAGNATMDEAYEALKPWIRHVHFHDGTWPELKFAPIGEGSVDHKRAVELLLAAGYKGYLSGEWIRWEEPDVHLPRELATMKEYEKNAS